MSKHDDWGDAFELSGGKMSDFEGYEDSAAVVGVFTERPHWSRAQDQYLEWGSIP